MNDEKIQIFISTLGEILVRDRDTLWIWNNGIGYPILAYDTYLHEQNFILVEEVDRQEWHTLKVYLKSRFR